MAALRAEYCGIRPVLYNILRTLDPPRQALISFCSLVLTMLAISGSEHLARSDSTLANRVYFHDSGL